MLIPDWLYEWQELRHKRTINTKVYTQDWISHVANCWVGVQHYNNSLFRRGDWVKWYRTIDHTPIWDNSEYGWIIQYDNAIRVFPKYSTDPMVFRNVYENYDIPNIYTPIWARIEWYWETDNMIVYPSTFWTWIDYCIKIIRSWMQKLVRFREWYYPEQDIDISWNTDLDPNYAIIKPFKIWDSNIIQKCELINYTLENKKLTKHIPASFFTDAIGDVYADTTQSFYAWAGDWYVWSGNSSSSRATIVWLSTWASFSYTATSMPSDSLARSDWTNRTLYRSWIPIDTSWLPDWSTINSAIFRSYNTTNGRWMSDSYNYRGLFQSTVTSNTVLANSDFNKFNTTLLSDTPNYSWWTINAYVSFTLNSSWVWIINKTWYTKLCLREWHDINTINPVFTSIEDNWWNFSTSEVTWTSQDPYISVTYDETPTSTFIPRIIIS